MHDFNADRAKRHAEREAEFGQKPFQFGYKPQIAEEKAEGKPPEPELFYVRANVGYLGIKRVASLSEESSGGETFEAIEASVISMIDPRDNALERLLAVTNNNDDPVTFDDLVELQNWLIEASSGRPPTQDQPSATTPPPTGEASAAPSSTAPEGASTA